MKTAPRLAVASALIGTALMATEQDAASQESAALSVAAGQAAGVDELRQWDATIDGMARSGDLVAVSRLGDRSLEGRTHEYLAQYYAGIPVFGAGVARQLDPGGVTVSLFGTLYPEINGNITPALSGAEVAALLEEMHGGEVLAGGQPLLGILPLPDGSHASAYYIAMSDGYFYFADAAGGGVLHRLDATREQSAVGAGADSQGNDRKLATTQADGNFQAHDRLRPAEVVTLDVRFNVQRYVRLLADHLIDGLPPGEPVWTADDYATDADNEWDDPTVVEAQAYTGWTYDYFSARHGWEGIDGANGRIISLVNLGFANAFFRLPPFGPEGNGVFGYGRRTDETSEEPYTGLDIVGHELMHGVTHFAVSNRTGSPFGLFNLVPIGARLGPTASRTARRAGPTGATPRGSRRGRDTGRAGHRAGAGLVRRRPVRPGLLGRRRHPRGLFGHLRRVARASTTRTKACRPTISSAATSRKVAIRSMSDPGYSETDPDTYADRYEFALTRGGAFEWDYSGHVFVRGEYFGTLRNDEFGYGGDHWNSLILSHAFYLAVEGGSHRTSGMTVDGVGGANRAEIEHIFFRAMRDLMPAMASLPDAAALIRQSAADLAPGSEAERAIDQALRAVGLAPGVR